MTIIRNNYIKFHELWINRSQVTVRHVYAGQTDRQTDRRTDGRTDGHRTFVYHNTSRQNFDGRIKRRYGMIAIETTLHKRPNDTEINNYRSPYGLQQ